MNRLIAVLLASLLVSGCAGFTPESLRDAPADSPALASVRADVDAYAGRMVYWGGAIAAVDNQAQATLLEVVERPLRGYGRPVAGDSSGGRFIVRHPGFLDPAIYKVGREVTVIGALQGAEQRLVGEHPVMMPVVAAERLHLWPELSAEDRYQSYPYWYDPYPFGPYYRPFYYPYYPHPYPHLYPPPR